jgi:ubiquinone/menaquinone biosynthesis C-methylase UbiE
MPKNIKKYYSDPWKVYADRYRDLYWAPGKPTEQERKIFFKFFKDCLKLCKTEKPKALVLGATPSVRDELAKLDVDVTLLDLNPVMVKAMNKLVTHNKQEKYVKGSWLDIPFKEGTFDIVAGDLVVGNIDLKNNDKFVKEVSRVLKPHGFWIHRIFWIPDNWVKLSVEEILKKFSKMKPTYNRSSEIFIHMLYDFFDKGKLEAATSYAGKQLGKFIKNGKFFYPQNKYVEGWLKDAYEMWKPFKKIWLAANKEITLSWFTPYFDIVKEESANDHFFAKWFPLIVCRKK